MARPRYASLAHAAPCCQCLIKDQTVTTREMSRTLSSRAIPNLAFDFLIKAANHVMQNP
jgi:hypothetical protein